MQPNNPIDHVVIIVKENHDFDNYLGTFPGVNGATLPAAQDPPTGGDPLHDHKAWLERATHAVKLQYSEKDIPSYFSFANQFTLCDNYFTEVASQSEPNHLMLIAAASPIIDNASKSQLHVTVEADYDRGDLLTQRVEMLCAFEPAALDHFLEQMRELSSSLTGSAVLTLP